MFLLLLGIVNWQYVDMERFYIDESTTLEKQELPTAPTEVLTVVSNNTLDSLSVLINVMQTLPDRIYESSMDMATSIRDNINKYADIVSGSNTEHTKDTQYTLIENKKVLDKLREKDKNLYALLLKLGTEKTVLNVYETQLIKQYVTKKNV